MATARGVLEPDTTSLRSALPLVGAQSSRRPTVLLVEDSPSDARLWAEAFEDGGDLTLRVVQTGELALDMVQRRPPYDREPAVDLVILDLGLQGSHGFDVLRALKSASATVHIPVIVFTGAASDPSVSRAYALHANSYICKPTTPDEFQHVVRLMRRFWLDVVRLPRVN